MDGGGELGLRKAGEAEVGGGEHEHEPGEEVVVTGVLEGGVEAEGEKGGAGKREEDVLEDGVEAAAAGREG